MTKVAVVTGAGSGIGRAVSIALYNNGYAVVLAGRRPKALEATAEQMRSAGGGVLAVPTDVSKPDQVRSLFAKAW